MAECTGRGISAECTGRVVGSKRSSPKGTGSVRLSGLSKCTWSSGIVRVGSESTKGVCRPRGRSAKGRGSSKGASSTISSTLCVICKSEFLFISATYSGGYGYLETCVAVGGHHGDGVKIRTICLTLFLFRGDLIRRILRPRHWNRRHILLLSKCQGS